MTKLMAVPDPKFRVSEDATGGDLVVTIPDPKAGGSMEIGLPLASVQYRDDVYPSPSLLFPVDPGLWETAPGSGLWDYDDPNPV